MKKCLVLMLFLAPVLAVASPKPSDYTTAVHVQSSLIVTECKGGSSLVRCKLVLHLNVLIDGKKWVLSGKDDADGVLRTGDYKAKTLGEAAPPDAAEYQQEYELLLSNGKTRTYRVVGESE